MKFRIMEDKDGRFVQKKKFGIWWNFHIFLNEISCLFGRFHYNTLSEKEIEVIVIENNAKVHFPTKLLKEFTV